MATTFDSITVNKIKIAEEIVRLKEQKEKTEGLIIALQEKDGKDPEIILGITNNLSERSFLLYESPFQQLIIDKEVAQELAPVIKTFLSAKIEDIINKINTLVTTL